MAALGANVGIAIAKFAAWGVTGSASMLSEGIHSVADSGNQVLLLVGSHRAKRVATAEHEFGFGRSRYLYGFVVSLVLFLAGGVFAVYEGIHKISHPEDLHDPSWAVGVLVIALVLETFSFRTAIREANRARGNRSLLEYVRGTKAPELPVVLLEDLGALVGLVIALACVLAAMVTGNGVWDGVGSLCIGVLLLIVAVFLGGETSSMLVGESAMPEERERIHAALLEVPEINRVIHLRTLHVGPDDILVGAKIAVNHDDSARQIARAIDAAERGIRAVVPNATYIYLEPDLDRYRQG